MVYVGAMFENQCGALLRRVLIVGAAAWMLLSGSAQAQDIPDPTNELRRNQELLREQQQRAQPQDFRPQGSQTPQGKSLPTDEERCKPIATVTVKGLPKALEEIGHHLLENHEVKRCYGVQAVGVLRERLQDRLMERGYVTSTVTVPEQNLSAGFLFLHVQMGTVSALINNSGQESGWHIRLGNTVPIKPGAVLNIRDVEQGLDNLKRVPGVTADIQIHPAQDSHAGEGSSDLRISYEQPKWWRWAVNLDDAGDKENGKYHGSTSIFLDNVGGVGDLFSLNAGFNPGGNNERAYRSNNYSLQYSIPMGYWSIELGHAKSAYRQIIQGFSQNYKYWGKTANNDIKLSRILHRDQQSKTLASLKAWQRHSSNYIDDTEVLVQRRRLGGWELVVNHKRYLSDGQWSASVTYRRGTRNFGAEPIAEELFDEGTGLMGLLWLDASASLPVPWLPGQWRYDGIIRLQKAHTRLIAQDRFSLGGRSSVRGFNGQSVLAAENGWYLRNGISHRLPWDGKTLYLGLDLGRVSGPASELQTGTKLAGAVLGARGQIGPAQLDVFIGAPLHKPKAFRAGNRVAGFSASLNF